MATVISRADGNFTTAATWGVADTTMLQETYNATSLTTTGNQDSLGFTPGAITIDGFIAHVLRVNTTGTVTFSLWNSTDSTTAATVTVNASDLPTFGPVLFSFGSIVLLAGKSYKLRITASSAGNYSIYRSTANSTAWDVALRTTTTAAPGAGDRIYVVGDWTAAATFTTRTVTMDNTATTIFGATSYLASFWIGSKGVLAYGTAASTNYYLKYRGSFRVTGSGLFTIGTSAARIPSTSTAVLEMDSVANVDTGLLIQGDGVFKTGGATKTTKAYLAADVGGICNTSGTTVTRKDGPVFTGLTGTFYVNGSGYTISSVTNANTLVLTGSAGNQNGVSWCPNSVTTLTTDVSTSWKSGDEFGITNASRSTTTGCEKKSLSIDASGTTLTVASAFTYGKPGTGVLKAEVMNLTRNVKIRGMSVSLCGYILLQDTGTIDRSFDETYYLGSASVNKYGVEINTATSGSYTETSCSNHDYTTQTSMGSALRVIGTSGLNINVSDSNYFNAGYVQVFSVANNYTNSSFDNLWLMGNIAQVSYGFYTNGAVNAAFTNLRVIGASGSAFYFVAPVITTAANIVGTIDNICAKNYGQMYIANCTGSIGDLEAYRSATHGVNFTGNNNLTVDSFSGSECASAPGTLDNNTRLLIKSYVADGGAMISTYSLYIGAPNPDSIIANAVMGAVVAATTSDLVFTGTNAFINFHNPSFNSATEVATSSNWGQGVYYGVQKYEGTTGDNRKIGWEGTHTTDTTIYNTLSPSLRMTPSRATHKLRSPIFFVPVESGNTATFQVQVRKSAAGDGTAYTGAQPRLMLRANPAAGITSDAVIATYSAGTGSWNTLSGSSATVSSDCVLEFYVDCDGTAGWVNVDDVSCSVPNPSGFKFWLNGSPYVDGIVIVTPTDVGLTFIGG